MSAWRQVSNGHARNLRIVESLIFSEESMNTVPTITPGSITGMNGLDTRPVYFLRLNGSTTPNLVVKCDREAVDPALQPDVDTSIKWGSKLMKNVNATSVNTKIMTPNEIVVFKQFAAAAFPQGSRQREYLASQYTWVKMPFVAGLSDADFESDDNNAIAIIKRNIAKFSDDQVWYDLGKILAVDTFNGNYDRFDINNGDWVNTGNVMFVANGPTKVVGLDTYDPNSDERRSNLVKVGGFDSLRKLVDPGQRRTFAVACVKSVGAKLKRGLGNTANTITLKSNGPNGPQMVRIAVSTLPDLFLPYSASLEAGFAAGADELKRYLQGKVRQYGGQWNRATPTKLPPRFGQARAQAAAQAARKTIPQGILDRMAYLGWNV